MSATYYGTFPVKKVTSYGPQGMGVVVSTASIVAPSASISSYVPEINTIYEFDSNLWVTNAQVDFKDNGLAEVKITAAGPSQQPSTTVEYQPNGPFIYGLQGPVEPDLEPMPNYSPSGGITIKVSFVDNVQNERNIISNYKNLPMPSSINGVELPAQITKTGEWTKLTHECHNTNRPNYKVDISSGTYNGYICKDVAISRMGSAIYINLYFKESGRLFLNYDPCANEGSVSLTKVFDY